jgi:hypothetical protein
LDTLSDFNSFAISNSEAIETFFAWDVSIASQFEIAKQLKFFGLFYIRHYTPSFLVKSVFTYFILEFCFVYLTEYKYSQNKKNSIAARKKKAFGESGSRTRDTKKIVYRFSKPAP